MLSNSRRLVNIRHAGTLALAVVVTVLASAQLNAQGDSGNVSDDRAYCHRTR